MRAAPFFAADMELKIIARKMYAFNPSKCGRRRLTKPLDWRPLKTKKIPEKHPEIKQNGGQHAANE